MTTSLIAAVVRLVCGASVNWQGCAPDSRQRIYFANHTSHLDFLLLWAALPPEMRVLTRPVAARDYWSNGRLRQHLATRVFNAVLIERKQVTSSNNPVTQMIDAMSGGHSLILFPEGGRNLNQEPGNFKSGLYHLAKHLPEAEFIPVWIDNLNRILPKGEALPVPFLSGVTFGAPIRLEPQEQKTDFLERARSAMLILRRS